MLTIRGKTIYRVGRLRSGYYILKFPPKDDADLIAANLSTEQDAINKIEEDYKNDKENVAKMLQGV